MVPSLCHGLFQCHADFYIWCEFVLQAVLFMEKITVQNNKGYFPCPVSGSEVLSAKKVKRYKLCKANMFVHDHPPASKEELLVIVAHLSPK